MKPPALVSLGLVCLAVGGCESTRGRYDPGMPIDKMSHEELCSYYTLYLSDPNLSAETRRIATEKRRQKGCSG